MRKISSLFPLTVLTALIMLPVGIKASKAAQTLTTTDNAVWVMPQRYCANPSLTLIPTGASDPETVKSILNSQLKNAATVKSSSGDSTYLIGMVVYSEKLRTGFYTVPTQSDETFDSLARMIDVFTYGMVEVDGTIYSNYYESHNNKYYLYKIDTEVWTVAGYDLVDYTLSATDMTHDPTTGNVYGIFWDDAAYGYVFGIADYSNLSRTAICDLDTVFIGIAADTDGAIYGLNVNGNLYKFDKTTGEQTYIGDTGIGTISYLGSLVVDPSDDALLWSHLEVNNNTPVGSLYEIDKTIGAAKQRLCFPGNEEVVGMFSATATEEESYYDFEVDGIYYTITSTEDKTVSVTYKTTAYNTYSGIITIPSAVTYNDVTYEVTAVGEDAFRSSVNLTNVTIPESVTAIEPRAFAKCISLTNIDIAKSVKVIGDSAFYLCSDMSSISLPSSVTTIGASAFCFCSSLTSVTSLNTTPPVWTSTVNAFNSEVYSSAYLYVPENTTEAYRATEPWSNFEIIGEIPSQDNRHFTIGSVDDWNTYAENFASYTSSDVFTLTADLDLTTNSVTSFEHFYGEFDGSGHTITICDTLVTSNTGVLFCNVDTSAVIHDFTVAGTLYTTAAFTAPVCYALYGTAKNVVNDVNITATSTYAAGIAATAYSGTLIDCGNNGTISGGECDYIAGVVGYDNGSTFTGCYNTGDITGYTNVGGIVCSAGNAASTFTYCYNTGNITGAYYLAGILAYQSATPNNTTFCHCYNTGDVTSTLSSGTQGYAGGISGYIRSEVSYTECYNAGDISCLFYVGGISGYGYRYSNTFNDCFNTGDITATASNKGYVGGIVGKAGMTTMNRCYNTGVITGYNAAGGVIGTLAQNNEQQYSNLYSSGVVVSNSSKSGYIYGCDYSSVSSASFNNIYAFDTIQNESIPWDIDSVTFVTYAELATLDLGDGWTAGDNYTYPRITSIADNDYAKAYAAAVIPADKDSYDSITQSFNVGTPDGVAWTASTDAITFDGNNVTFSESFSGTITLTVTAGEVSRAIELTCNVEVNGISDITGASREVVSETFYNLTGAQVAEPADGARAIYIVVKSYSDGTTETVKEVR